MNTAIKIKDLDDFTGKASLYRLEPAVKYDKGGRETHYVVVSATHALSWSGLRPETFIFPADQNGEVIHWGELDGSFKDGLDHEEALAGAGYTIHDLA